MYYDDTLATNDKSNRLAHLSARSLDCMPGIHNELEPEVKISLTESWIVASQRPAEHTRVSNEHKLSRHLRVESVEPHKAGITLLAADCWSTAAHHCACPIASGGWWRVYLLPCETYASLCDAYYRNAYYHEKYVKL